jgi:uncharacterized membrane-anchored protein YhcB (DUF1043 family)
MEMFSYEFYGLLIAVVGLGLTILKMWLDSKEKLAKHQMDVNTALAVQKGEIDVVRDKIAEHKAEVTKDLEQVKRDRADRVAAVYAEIDAIKRMRETDVKELTVIMEKAIERTANSEKEHHNEVIGKINALTVQLTDMCSTFKEYRNHQDDKQAITRRRTTK